MNKKIIDANYTEENGKVHSNTKPLYYTTKDVAEILSESEPTIRYWTTYFDKILKIETVGRNRKFTEKNIQDLLYIQTLRREKNLSMEQVLEVFSQGENNILENVSTQDPLILQALASALTQEMSIHLNNQLQDIKTQIIEEVNNQIVKQSNGFNEMNDELRQHIAITIDEKLSEVNQTISKVNENIETNINKTKEHDVELVNKLTQKLEEHKNIYKEQLEQNSNKKGFFSKLWGK